jgi:hypothetical protein
MDVFGREHDVEPAVLLDDVALANGAGDDFQSGFPKIAGFRPVRAGGSMAGESVSGRNILN